VEILGAMQERFPELPEPDPEELAQLKTLRQVAGLLEKSLGKEPARLPEKEKMVTSPVVECGIAAIKKLPGPDILHVDCRQDRVCLVGDDGTPVCSKLVTALVQKGFKTVVLRPSRLGKKTASGLPKTVRVVALKNEDEAHLKETIDGLSKSFGGFSGAIVLAGANRSGAKAELLFSFLLAKHLKQALCADPKNFRPFFLVATRLDGALGFGRADFDPAQAGLFGLVKTLNLEWGRVFCRAIDLGTEKDAGLSAGRIMAELCDPDRRIVETGYGPEGRVTLEPEPAAGLSSENPSASPDSVFLVSGGARGVTAKCVAALAKAAKCGFILLGRSEPLEEDPGWARNCDSPPELKRRAMEELVLRGEKPSPNKVRELLGPVLSGREIRATLSSIQRAGARAVYVAADVTDGDALARKLPSAVSAMGPVTGIIHGAGVLADKHIEDKTIGEFEAVYSTKVEGLSNLLSAVEPGKLSHLVLFSSAAGFYGNPGQSDYAAANEILNKNALLFSRRFPGCRTISFNWGPWDGGMVTPELKTMFEKKNIAVIPMEAGTRIFVDGVLSEKISGSQILVGSSMLTPAAEPDREKRTVTISRCLSLADNSFLNDHVIGENAVLPAVCAISWMADSCLMLYPQYRFASCMDYNMYKGIVFDKTLAGSYTVQINGPEKTGGTLKFDVTVSSQNMGGRTSPHYAGRILLSRTEIQAPAYNGRVEKSQLKSMDAGDFYKDGTLFHGPLFQAVEKVLSISPERLTALCRINDHGKNGHGQFHSDSFHPVAADTLFQCMLIWVRRFCDAGSLPARARALEHFRPVPRGEAFYVSLDVLTTTRTGMEADVTCHDESGKVYARLLGAEVTMSRRLNGVFAKASGI
jgi:NAD(P)-dependent dehydrogenase (short-subunit alcohol dehydrogenase family)